MSDNNAKVETPAAVPAKSKMPMIVMGVGIASLIGAAAIVFLGHSSAKADKPKDEHAAKEAHGEAAAHEEAADEHAAAGFNHKLESFIANLANDDGEMHYIKCSITVEIADEHAVAQLEKKVPRIRQEVLLYLSGLTMAQTDGGEAKRKVREGLDAAVKGAAGKDLVKNVYVVELVVQ